MPSIEIAQERWKEFWVEGEALCREEYIEAKDSLWPQWEYNLDVSLLAHLDIMDVLQIWTARVNGKLVGYIWWTLQNDPESKNLRMAVQGPWFVKPDHKFARLSLGKRLYDQSTEYLRTRG